MNNKTDKTRRLFEEDSHLKEFRAVVLQCKEAEDKDRHTYQVLLDQTAFFPEGGGQYADTGTITITAELGTKKSEKGVKSEEAAAVSVLDVQEEKGMIWHQTNTPLEIGCGVTGIIDYDKRFDCMQQHSGEHLVSGIVHQLYGYRNVGFHLGEAEVTMDFDGPLSEEQLILVETKANEAVVRNMPVETLYPSQQELEQLDYRSKIEIEGQVRVIRIADYDLCACCAPHVKNTGEIGIIKITGCQKYKAGVRVSLHCGSRALADYRLKQNNIQCISTLLSVPAADTAAAVSKQKDEIFRMKGRMMELEDQIVAYKANAVEAGSDHALFFETDLDGNAMRKLENAAVHKVKKYSVVFTGDDRQGYRFIAGCANCNCRELLEEWKQHFEVRGGGSKEMVQGTIKAERARIEQLFSSAV